jgi:hypothetical protein
MVNDPFMPLDHAQYLFIHDSVHGKFQGMCEVAGDALVVNGSRVRFTGMHACADIPWASEGVETVAECTGAFTTTAKCAGHLAGGARAVVISAPAHDEGTPTYVVGVNHEQYRAGEAVVSMASCTTNCLAPLVKVVLEQWDSTAYSSQLVGTFDFQAGELYTILLEYRAITDDSYVSQAWAQGASPDASAYVVVPSTNLLVGRHLRGSPMEVVIYTGDVAAAVSTASGGGLTDG